MKNVFPIFKAWDSLFKYCLSNGYADIIECKEEVCKCLSVRFNDIFSRIVPENMEVPFNNKSTEFTEWNYFVRFANIA